MSTAIELRSGGTLTVSDEFAGKYPALAPDEEMAELLAESLGDESLGVQDFPKIRVPSGGDTQFKLIRDGEETYVKEITGVLVYHKPQRVYWTDPEPSGKAPDCSSADGKRPVASGLYGPQGELAHENATGLCANCPMAQAGSDPNPKNRGAACKDQKLLFLVQPGEMFPSVVVAPPSSLREVKQFMIGLVNSRTPWWSVEVALTLEKATNAAGISFARIKVRPTGKLESDDVTAVRDYSDYIKGMVKAAIPAQFVDGDTVRDGETGGLRIPEAATA
jgi:hypothetical protein